MQSKDLHRLLLLEGLELHKVIRKELSSSHDIAPQRHLIQLLDSWRQIDGDSRSTTIVRSGKSRYEVPRRPLRSQKHFERTSFLVCSSMVPEVAAATRPVSEPKLR